ncbi:protein PIN-LIKES 7-like isoform X1 [Dioscorea cayenensis subsp. rotundata]|uniref:Protein PIN-LIKES 7-like isoform X1 n=1 Tax=Dioscorea cayennensis subsp. rotundata TaxID=55577 RepID=A0AB40CFG9_DIOCR|nr:protein PIN-LIKES 7-like isoform X1 [Dioscorea cayenensis subsp. rotundata]XP_039137848.1 protein PIN-LIKES 7-like isoform X1 [Dioscorea cayenensis subsp. rotundata]
MGFLSLLMVASMPVVQVLLIGLLGAFLATKNINVLTPTALKDINKVVYMVFTPSLVFFSFAKSITLQGIISWWFMPVNIGIIFLLGSVLGWVIVKVLRPGRHLEGLIIANCSAGNLGNLMLILIPAICAEDENPFGKIDVCRENGITYVSLSMALGGIFIWTHTYSLMQKDGILREKMMLNYADHEAYQIQTKVPLLPEENVSENKQHFMEKLKPTLHRIVEELMTPPIVAVIVGFIVGVIPWIKSLIFGLNAPLRVLQDSLKLLGDGLLPCIILILGGNLTRGLHKSEIKTPVIVAIICMRYIVLPIAGIGVVRAVKGLGLLPSDTLFAYVLLVQYTLPPGMSIGTMAQLFNAGQEECSVIFLWTYLVAALAVTGWSSVFMWILT